MSERPEGRAVPVYGLFEAEMVHAAVYENPFMDVILQATFRGPPGDRQVEFPGFYDGDGRGGPDGKVWKLRFMPDRPGKWTYSWRFSDGSGQAEGSFLCTARGAKPGPWKQDQDNPHWFKTASGERFLPVAMHADCPYAPADWSDAIQWCAAFGFNTLVTSTFNTWAWGDGWPNVTAFATADAAKKQVRYDRFNIPMWNQWDDMIRAAGDSGIYVAPFNGPTGFYGGRRWKYPPEELAYWPEKRDGWDTPENLALIRYLIARQGAFWNLAYWSLGGTEIYNHLDEDACVRYGENFASVTPFGRMITAQDAEQWHAENRRWLSKMSFPSSRKLNAVQTAVADPNRPAWGKSDIANPVWNLAGINNEFALDCYGGFPVLTTEGLWEGQGRAKKPLRIIWGFLAAGAHVMWADWSYEFPERHEYGSIGRGWAPPVKGLDRHQFRTDQLGADCVGHRQLLIATEAIRKFRYWKMAPHNELVAGSDEAYCLAEAGKQYMVYAPNGGQVSLDLSSVDDQLAAKWLDPRTGDCTGVAVVGGRATLTLTAPSDADWVLLAAEGGHQ